MTKEDRGPLFEAAVRGDLKRVKALLDGGEPPERTSEPHYTPLQAAVAKGHSEVVLVLLRHGANPQHPDKDGQTALSRAIWYQKTELIEQLLAVCPPKNLRDAAGVGDLERVRQMVASGTPVNDAVVSRFGPLYYALLGQHIEVARYLIAQGAVPTGNLSVLQGAASFGATEIVREEIDRHGDRLAQEVPNALWEAATGDHVEVLRLLLDRYPTSTEQLDRALGRAACSCAIGAIRLLVEAGADINHRWEGQTLVALAREWSDDRTAAALLELGAPEE